ncbi:hypothetical protein LTR66_015590 [Elasticomyces elasticus]|nr:hypothetical protein LTR66_015590 [Elasticomyces elasticus]
MSKAIAAPTASESEFKVSLHPLVLITVSDLITRHNLRHLEGPIAGLLLGQQQGNVVTAEHAFTAKIKDGLLDETQDWTSIRIAQYKEVHQNPILEVVGWFTLCPPEGPTAEQALLHKQLSSMHPDTPSPVLVAIHPQEFADMQGTKAKLPVSVYESVPEVDGSMQVDGAASFRPVPFSIDTDETEMIAINYIAKGAGSAAALAQDTSKKDKDAPSTTLTSEEEDQISGINTRLNSVRMLKERTDLMSRFIQSIPPDAPPTPDHMVHLRNIQALLTRLSLLDPSTTSNLQQGSQTQSNDVALQSILSMFGQDIQGLSELGRKFSTVEQGRQGRHKGDSSFNQFGSRGNFVDPIML